MWDYEDVQLVMIPSLDEINGYTGDNLYYCGLEETRVSVEKLLLDAINGFFKDNRSDTEPHFATPQFVRMNDRLSKEIYGNAPETVFNVIITLVTGGMGAGVYKLLNLWVKSKNGRKIHVKLPNGLVIDATQMTHDEFSEFLSEVYDVYFKYEKKMESLKGYASQKNLRKVTPESERKIELELSAAVRKKEREIQKRLSPK